MNSENPSHFLCPVCKTALISTKKSLVCENSHSFDKAKSGYVNLFINPKSSAKNHGDNKLMTSARRDFLNKDFYLPLKNALCKIAKKYAKPNDVVFDCGCGEGYYTDAIRRSLESVSMIAIDISKDEISTASKRNKNIEFAVASAFNLPIKPYSVDILFEIFSPYSEKEFLRVLKDNGIMIIAFPLENHLFQLKKSVYDVPYKNEVSDLSLNGFSLIESLEIKNVIKLNSNEDIKNLFMMTPYYYKTGVNEQARLDTLQTLSVETEFCIAVYRKKGKQILF
ncbi:MAG: methyltransferase domain-containing protein [Oscillospiraceae bacterium]